MSMIKKPRIFVLLVLSTFIPVDFFSQTGIKGTIADSLTAEPLIGVTAVINGTSKGTTSDLAGGFLISNVAAGSYVLQFSYIGYKEQRKAITVTAGETLDLGTIQLSPKGILLNDIEVNSSIISFKDESKIPTAVSTISGKEIDERMGGTEFPEILNSTPGVYSSMNGGGYGDGSVVIRGYGSQNTAVLLNGVPVNDMENGIVYWSNWSGLNEVTRTMQVQRGLGFSKLGVSSIGGTYNILIKPAELYKGVSASYSRSNLAFQDHISVTASTGLLKGNWAVTASGSRRWGPSYRKGVSTDAWAYFLSAYKKIGTKHQLLFTGFGAPQKHGAGYDATQSQYQTYGYIGDSLNSSTTYNSAWGYSEGKVRNRSLNHYHKPQFMFNHYWDLTPKTKISNSAYWSFGRGGGSNLQRSYGAPSLSGANYIDVQGQLLWDSIYSLNRRNIETIDSTSEGKITGARSKYYLEDRVNDHNWYGVFSNIRSEITERFTVVAGIDARYYQGTHYAKVIDLLGGDYMVDKDPFRKMTNGDNADNNLYTPGKVARVGDKVRYQYKGTVDWLGVFAQGEYSLKKFDFFLTGNFSRTSFFREGLFDHELFASTGNSGFGKSVKQQFFNYTAKAGVNYRINGKHNVFVNTGYFNRAPFFTNAYIDSRQSAQTMQDLTSEKISSAEFGYVYRSSMLTFNLNGYYTQRKDWMYTESFSSPDYDGRFKNFITSGVGAIHQGLEMDFKLKPVKKLDVTGMLSIGDWRWKGNPKAIVRDDNTLGVDTTAQTIYIDGMAVGNSAQTTAGLGARYQFPFYAYLGFQANYFDNLYMDYNPSIRVNPATSKAVKMKSYYLLDVYIGKSFKIKKHNQFIKLKLNVNNVLGEVYLTRGREAAASDGISYYYQFGRPRTFFANVTYNF